MTKARKETYIELRVHVSDDSFESSLRVPVLATKAEKELTVEMWIEAMGRAIALTESQKEPVAESESGGQG